MNVKNVIAQLSGSDLLSIKGGGTLLHAEATLGNHETCYFLLHRAAQLGCRKEVLAAAIIDGRLALQLACERGHLDVVRLLLNEGSPMLLSFDNDDDEDDDDDDEGSTSEDDAKTKKYDHPFQLARLAGHYHVCELLLERRNEFIAQTETIPGGLYLFHDAVESKNIDLVSRLLTRGLGGDLEVLSANDQSYLDFACINNDNIDMVKLLLEYDAEISVNSLIEACLFGSVELVRLLISNAKDAVLNISFSHPR